MDMVKAWLKYIRRYIETWMGVSAAIFLLGGLCLGVPMLLVELTDSEVAPYLLIAGAVVFLGIVFGGTFFYAFRVLRQRRERLDAAFAPDSIPGMGFSFNGRQYHGSFRGRQLDAYYFRGPALDLYLSTSMQTRLDMGRCNQLSTAPSDLLQHERLSLPDPAYKAMNIYADDPDWAAQWLADEDVKTALIRLLPFADEVEVRTIALQPGAIRLSIRSIDEIRITAEAVHQWLEGLCAVILAAERLPASQTASSPLSVLEKTSRENRGAFTLPAFLMVLGVLLLVTVCLVIAFVILLSVPQMQ